MKHLHTQNHYELLGVERTATIEEIRDAYTMGKQAFEPNSMAAYSLVTEEESETLLKMMYDAYIILSNSKERRRYDEVLKRAEQKKQRQGRSSPKKSLTLNSAKPSAKEKKATAEKQRKVAEKFADALDGVTHFNGETLRKLRNIKGSTLQQVAEKTKIRLLYLRAIEEEQFEMLPAIIYVKGFVRLYSQELGLPVEKVLKDYSQSFPK